MVSLINSLCRTNRIYQNIRIESGETVSKRFNKFILTGNMYLECPEKKDAITINDVTGVLFEELPGDEDYRGHHYAH